MPKNRRKIERETADVAAMTRRMVRALGRRIGDGDPIDLNEFRALRAALDEAEQAAVDAQRQFGFSWAQIADGLGTSRQNAQQRFTRKATAPATNPNDQELF